MHVHHTVYEGALWEPDISTMVTLCDGCHETTELIIKDVRKASLSCESMELIGQILRIVGAGFGADILTIIGCCKHEKNIEALSSISRHIVKSCMTAHDAGVIEGIARRDEK